MPTDAALATIALFDRKAPSLRPDHALRRGHRAQGRSMMAEGHRRRRREASLTGPSTMASWSRRGPYNTVAPNPAGWAPPSPALRYGMHTSRLVRGTNPVARRVLPGAAN